MASFVVVHDYLNVGDATLVMPEKISTFFQKLDSSHSQTTNTTVFLYRKQTIFSKTCNGDDYGSTKIRPVD